MKLSIWSGYYHDISPEEAVERFIANGIFCSELSDEHGNQLMSRSDDVVKVGSEFADFLHARCFEISQGHLWITARICADNSALEKLFKWIDLYEAIGIKNMVLHCDDLLDMTLSKSEKMEMNVDKLRLLASYIEEKPISICLENLGYYPQAELVWMDKYVEDLLSVIEQVGSTRFGICLDTGHLNLNNQSQREFILKAGNKLKALHIADNNGLSDQHLMPYNRGNIDFKEVMQALEEIGYTGTFNLEIPGEIRIPIELRDAKLSYIIACYHQLRMQG